MSQLNNQNPGPGKNLDDLFRDAIGNQEVTPSPMVWKSLNWKLLIRELMHFNFTNVPRLAIVSATVGLVVVASLTYWAVSHDSDRDSAPSQNIPVHSGLKPATVPATVKSTAAERSYPIKSANYPVKQDPAVASRPSHTLNRNPWPSSAPAAVTRVQLATNAKPASPSVPVIIEPTAIHPESPSQPSVTKEVSQANETSSLVIEPLNSLDFSGFTVTDDTLTFVRNGEVFKYVREKIPVPSFFSANLGVAPELSVYTSNGTSTAQGNYWLNAGLAYHFSRFSVRTGLGIGYTYDEGKYLVSYRSNDSVSYYRKVIGYIQDPANPGHLIYITRNQAIYDSLNHIADDRTRNRYTYIQVPLLIGYSIYETSRFRLGFEIGPAVSFLIGSKKAEPVVDYPNGRLIKVEDNTPSRLSTNWQLWLDLSIEYQFTRNWGLSINPYYKYFITNQFQSTESGTPDSQAFGLDIGIQYFFGRKDHKK